MKTIIITIATICSLAAGTVNTAKADNAPKSNNASTVLSDINHISKIEVRGNVELFISAGADDRVKVYNDYYAENALVQNQNGVLRITSYTMKKLVVWVTAADLRAISVYDNASVKSFGELSAINLNVQINNNASAQLKLSVYNASISVNDNAKADISGNVNECDLNYATSASVNYSQLQASRPHVVKNTTRVYAQAEELAVL